MCSIIGRLNLYKNNIDLTKTSTNNADDITQWCITFTFVTRLFAYITILIALVMVIFIILKYILNFDYENTIDDTRITETSSLQSRKITALYYGTCHSDIESGHCSSSSSNNNSSSDSSSSMELYDGKLCVICYDEERNCFFVPCGHCATCYVCATRIFYGENKVCPVCRRFIGKVRKLFAS